MQLEFTDIAPTSRTLYHASTELFRDELENFHVFDTQTIVDTLTTCSGETISVFTNEFWTTKQRAASSLHEVSYRACFKPQLPRFFVERLTKPGDLVYDPLITRVGKLELRVPQDRSGRFSTEIFERYHRSEKAPVAALTEM